MTKQEIMHLCCQITDLTHIIDAELCNAIDSLEELATKSRELEEHMYTELRKEELGN